MTVLSLNTQEIQRGIDDFELDAGLTYLDNEPLEHVQTKPICHEEYLFLTPATGPLRRRNAITWREAARGAVCAC